MTLIAHVLRRLGGHSGRWLYLSSAAYPAVPKHLHIDHSLVLTERPFMRFVINLAGIAFTPVFLFFLWAEFLLTTRNPIAPAWFLPTISVLWLGLAFVVCHVNLYRKQLWIDPSRGIAEYRFRSSTNGLVVPNFGRAYALTECVVRVHPVSLRVHRIGKAGKGDYGSIEDFYILWIGKDRHMTLGQSDEARSLVLALLTKGVSADDEPGEQLMSLLYTLS